MSDEKDEISPHGGKNSKTDTLIIPSRLPHAFRRLAELLRPRPGEAINDELPRDDEPEPRLQ